MSNIEYILNSGEMLVVLPTLIFSPSLVDDPKTSEIGSKMIYEAFWETDKKDVYDPLPKEFGTLD